MKEPLILDFENLDFQTSTRKSSYYRIFEEISSEYIFICYDTKIIPPNNPHLVKGKIVYGEYFTTRIDGIKIYHKLTHPNKVEMKELLNQYTEYFI